MIKQIKLTGLLMKAGAKLTLQDDNAKLAILTASATSAIGNKSIANGLETAGITTLAFSIYKGFQVLDAVRAQSEDKVKSEG